MGPLRLGMIGCGGVAEFHVPAFRAAGFELTAVCGRPGSTRSREFARRHGIGRPFEGARELLGAREAWDALLIAVPADALLEVLWSALETEAPILVEKPVALRSADLKPLFERECRVIVGYNRRFYPAVQAARREVLENPPLLGHLTLPDYVSTPAERPRDNHYLTPFFDSSVHGLDLACFVFGNLRVVAVERLADEHGALRGLAGLLRSERGDVLQITANWRTPWNWSLILDRPARRFELRPFEAATIYEEMEIVEPTGKNPIRTYRPTPGARITLDQVDHGFKPGFVRQAQALAALARSEDPSPAANLRDAYEVLALAEDLAGQGLDR